MLYRIQLYTDKLTGKGAKYVWEDVWCYKDGHFDVGDTEWVRSANSISSLTFDCYPSNQCHDLLDVNSRIRILNQEGWLDTGDYCGFKTEFCGRVIEVTPQMDESGLVYKNVVCEDALGFLQDSVLYFDSNKGWFDGGNSNYSVDIDGDGVRTIGAEDLVRLIVGQHNSTVSANDKMGSNSWKKIYVGDLDLKSKSSGKQLDVDLDAQYTATGYELLCDIADDLGAQFSVTYDADEGNNAYLNVASTLGGTGGTFEVGDNLAQSALETSIAATATRLFPWGDEYAKLKEVKAKGTNVSGRMDGTEWESTKSACMARFDVEGGLKAHMIVGARNKDYAMVIFTSKKLTKDNAKKSDVVLRKYTTKAKATGTNLERWYAVPEGAKYCYVYGTTGSGSKLTLYSEYKRKMADGDEQTIKDKYRVDLAFWLKYLKDSDKSDALEKYGLKLGSVTDKSDDKLYYLSRNEDKYGVIEGAYEVDKCHLKTEKITQSSTKVTSVTNLVTVGKSKTKKWRQTRARIFFKAACKEAKKRSGSAVTVTAKVIDMRAGRYEDYPELHLFDKWHLVNGKCGIDHTAQLTRISCDLREPWNADVEFGDKVSRASGVGGTGGGSLSNGNMGDIPSETDSDDDDDFTATVLGEATEKAAAEAVAKADELDKESYQIKVDAWAAGELAGKAEEKVSPITSSMRGLLAQAEEQAAKLTGVVERQEKTISLSSDLANAVASYSCETEKSVVKWRQTYTAQLDAWASEDPDTQKKIADAYALLYGGTVTEYEKTDDDGNKSKAYKVVDASGNATGPDNVTSDSAQGHLNSAKAERVTAQQTKNEMDSKLAEAKGNLAATQDARDSAQKTYDNAKAAYAKAKKNKKASRKSVDKAATVLNAAKASLASATESVEAADARCAKATENFNEALDALNAAEAKVTHAQSEVDTAMNGIHQLYSSTIEQTAKGIKLTAEKTEAQDKKIGKLEVTAEDIKSSVEDKASKSYVDQKASSVTSTIEAKGYQTASQVTQTLSEWKVSMADIDGLSSYMSFTNNSGTGTLTLGGNSAKILVGTNEASVRLGPASISYEDSVLSICSDGNYVNPPGIYIKENGVSVSDGTNRNTGSLDCGPIHTSGSEVKCGDITSDGYVLAYGNIGASGDVKGHKGEYEARLTNGTSSSHDGWHGLYSQWSKTWLSWADMSGTAYYNGTKNTASSKFAKYDISNEDDEYAEKLLSVDVVRFKYKAGFRNGYDDNGYHFGVIAEDVYEMFPEAISNPCRLNLKKMIPAGEDTSEIGVDYETFIPHLIKLCQMQQEQIDALEKRVAALEGGTSGTSPSGD